MPNKQHYAGKAPGGRRLQRWEAGVDQIGDDLRGKRVHPHRREEEGGEQRPERVMAHGACERPARVDETGVGFLAMCGEPRREQPPRQQQQRHQQAER